MKSPCINVCQMDPRRGVCLGCARTLDEIARWASMRDEERQEILNRLDERKRALDVPKVPMPPLA